MPTTCPRCRLEGVEEPACPRCGVVFAKVRPSDERPRRTAAAPIAGAGEAPAARPRAHLSETLLLLLALSAGVWIWRSRRADAPVALRGGTKVPEGVEPRSAGAPLPPIPLPTAEVPRPPAERVLSPAGAADPDSETAVLLGGKLSAGATMTPDDVATAEQILERHPAEPAARNLLESILIAISNQERLGQRHSEAVGHLRRAIEVEPASRSARLGLLSALLESSDWRGAEAAARDLLAQEPKSLEALRGLGMALMRQDRDTEAREALRAALEIREDAASRELYDRIVRSLASQRGMTEQRLSHFNVRYDGGQHEDVGREMLRVLERHFATLARTFDHEPTTTIPVVLFSQQSYYDATGAPFWSGGQYSHAEGRITVPIGGLSASLSPTLDRVLIHELSHAFISDLSRGAAPREIQEGLAQYLEGKRVEDEIGRDGMQALAEGRTAGVMGFYLTALAFVEQLMGERGQGGINDLLRALGETGRVDDAFQRVYGRSFAEEKQAFAERFRRQHAR